MSQTYGVICYKGQLVAVGEIEECRKFFDELSVSTDEDLYTLSEEYEEDAGRLLGDEIKRRFIEGGPKRAVSEDMGATLSENGRFIYFNA